MTESQRVRTALRALAAKGGELGTLSELYPLLNASRSYVSNALRDLENEGVISRYQLPIPGTGFKRTRWVSNGCA